ncbi:NEDD8-specific protease 1 [Hibiscus syriacus]|uniref:NEDD8-specific protease 1 n=1 Tax=Hibiscus syriacus TaxID=106335 RepID=A0A6A2WL85_HIBSY|nr:NEDD8-specific protease 1-like [Hibiscus syriacus]XP_039052352.1 NEDD8-specific protease 1-like [Hibiscus syriacus]XP_039052353.1 NEDD8-specific protease 1-like [Hibiscus syriacus]XP_039052354.1 NEDD8-specific protease 1-like [Hibiscus syriacus]KAE8656715.1 NEDD8-specific protease 1 [Hibiscus syriacus]
MGKSAADEMILSYNDVVLRRSDLEILGGPYYLNDRIIEFYFSLLSASHPSQDILLVSPSIAFWITNCPDVDGLKDFLEPLKLPDKNLVLFPVNNNDDVSLAEGGSHWSLLAYYRSANVFVHHDSSQQMNKRPAMKLYKSVVGYISGSCSAGNDKYLECSDTPQQVNCYDCGLYVTATARTICSWYESSESKNDEDLWFSAVKEQVTPLAVCELRKEILRLIKDLMAKQ